MLFNNKNSVHEINLVEGCKKHIESVEKEVFTKYSPMLRGICIRYATDKDQCEDMLQEGLIKIFDTIKSFKWQGEGSFTAWIRRVMINNSINYYKKNKRLKLDYNISEKEIPDEIYNESEEVFSFEAVASSGISQNRLLEMIKELPDKYSMVFNMSVIDGYRHKQIADILGIDESSSRSRLLRSKKMLQHKLSEYLKDCKMQKSKNYDTKR